ncbi:MAG: hypothetical protein WC489_00640 [Patescibacteria group bacterium]
MNKTSQFNGMSLKNYLFKEKWGRLLLLLSIFFAYKSAGKSNKPELEFVLNLLFYFIIIVSPSYLYYRWRMSKKFEKEKNNDLSEETSHLR